MNIDTSLLGYFFHASLMVKGVMLVLLGASVISWIIIFRQGLFLQAMNQHIQEFIEHFSSTPDMAAFYREVNAQSERSSLENIIVAGFKELNRLKKRSIADTEGIITGVQRAMGIARLQFEQELEGHVSLLATIGSVSPYIGLFGTVWGIMSAFQALGHVSQATISMVAPGISEALIATAMGLLAAIPAVIAYNRYNDMINHLNDRCEAFQEEFIGYLYRELKRST